METGFSFCCLLILLCKLKVLEIIKSFMQGEYFQRRLNLQN